MTASAWQIYDSFVPKMSTLATDTFKCAFFTSTYTPARTDDAYSALTGELANGSGYVTGGAALTTVTLADVSGETFFKCDDIVLTPSGADLVVRYAVIYNYTDTGKQLVAVCLLDDTSADVTVYDGFPLTIDCSGGVFKTSGGW